MEIFLFCFLFRSHQLDQWMGLVSFGLYFKSMPKWMKSNGLKHFLHHFNLHCLNCHKYHGEQCLTHNKHVYAMCDAIYVKYMVVFRNLLSSLCHTWIDQPNGNACEKYSIFCLFFALWFLLWMLFLFPMSRHTPYASRTKYTSEIPSCNAVLFWHFFCYIPKVSLVLVQGYITCGMSEVIDKFNVVRVHTNVLK